MVNRINTFYFCTQDYHVIFANKIISYGYQPIGFLKNRSNRRTLQYLFPNIINFEYHDFLKSNLKFKNFYKNIVPVEILNKMHEYFNEYSKILLRQDTFISSISLSNSLNIYNSNIEYWYNLFIENDIQLNIFEEEPHKSTTYLVYQLSKIMNIKTYMPLRTIWQLGIIPISNYENKNKDNLLSDLFKSKTSNKQDINFNHYINTLSSKYEDVIKHHLWNQVDDIKGVKNYFNLKKFLKLKSIFNFKYYSSDFKTYFSKLEKSKENYFNYLINKTYKLIYINKLKKNYRKFSKNINLVNLKNKYIYFPLQMQPEKSTLPLAGVFEDAFYTIKFLLEYTPKEFKILIKEHPTHFIYWRNTTNLMWRSNDFYKKLINLNDRIILVDQKSDVFKLIDNSIFVASVGGTVCWEAAVRGKRSLNFSKIWFDNCPGVSTISDEKDLNKFIKEKLYEKKVIKSEVVDFAKQIFNLGYNSAHGNPEELKHLKISPEKNAEILTEAFLNYFQIK